jgi:hypothetical protein
MPCLVSGICTAFPPVYREWRTLEGYDTEPCVRVIGCHMAFDGQPGSYI